VSPLLPKALRRKPKTGRRRGMHPLAIAAIMIIVPIVLIYYAFEHTLPFIGSNYTDYAIVPNSVNVRGGSPVRIAGVNVGQVSSVTADGDATKIGFTLDAAARPMHIDATVTIRDRLFLEGGYYLALEPGSPSAPVAREGFTIQEKNTATPVQFFQILSTFDSAARLSLQNLLNTSNVAFSPSPGDPESDSGAGAFKQAIPELTPVLKDTSQIAEALTGTHAGDVETLLSSTSDVTTTLAQHREQFADMFAKLDTVAGVLAGEDDAIGRTISGVDGVLKQAPSSLVAVNRSLTPLDTLSAALTPALKQSGPLLTSLTTQVSAVNQIIKPGQRTQLIAALHNFLIGFDTTLGKTADLFPSIGEPAACLAEKVTPLLEEDVQDGSHSTDEPVYKDLLHMLPSLAGASGNYDADGPYLRVLAGLGSDTVSSSILGSVPGVSTLVGSIAGTTESSTSSTDSIQGIAPQWVGDLPPSAFRPDVACTDSSDVLPTNLVADPSQADK
jgi:phospholipid/cholesterol/gamma-HCH transport system substrate-binding protein